MAAALFFAAAVKVTRGTFASRLFMLLRYTEEVIKASKHRDNYSELFCCNSDAITPSCSEQKKILLKLRENPLAYLGPRQTSVMKFFAKIVNI